MTMDAKPQAVIDCDIHPTVRSAQDLLGYMSKSWQRHFDTRGIRLYGRARDAYAHPLRIHRLDAAPPGGGPAGSDPEYVLARHVAPNNIRAALLLPQEPYGAMAWGDAAAAGAYYRGINDLFLEQWVATDPRFCLAISVSAHDPHAAAKEIRRQAGTPGVIAIQVLLLDQMLGSTWFDPIYQAACDAQLPIAFHQSGVEACYSTSQGIAGGVPRSYGERHVGLTQIGAANLVDLIVSGAFERFPGLRVVMIEWGFSWVPALLARLDWLWESDPLEAPQLTRLPSEYVAEHVNFTTQPLDEPGTTAELRSLFADPDLARLLLFSSDYPHYDTDDPRFIINRIPPSMREQICFQNAVDTFGRKILR